MIKDLQELKADIYPKYEKAVTVKKTELIKNSKNLRTALEEQDDRWHREIDHIVNCKAISIKWTP